MAYPNFENVNNTQTDISITFLGPINTTHHVFFEFQPKKDKRHFVKKKLEIFHGPL